MDKEALEKRKRIMSRSINLGHCVCDPNKDCPCPKFKEKNICECAGERENIVTGEVKLTEHVRAVGCASKVPKKYLHDVISKLTGFKDDRVLVGYDSSDDAGVLQIRESDPTASILTVDVFAPSVDDPYTFGMIAAANSLSDIYAMGGKAESALSIVGFPIHSLPEEAMSAMLQGGADKMTEAEVAIIGGHSINDSEVKCGYAVLGSVEKSGVISNSNAEVDDVLVLTKPIGGGIVLFGKQIAKASEEEVEEVTTSMTTLNRTAGEAMKSFNANAATDVTGFSLLGHLSEMAIGSLKVIEVDFSAVPLFSGVERLARLDAFPGAVERNREATADSVEYNDLSEAEQNILYSPETSGGLLISMPRDRAQEYITFLADSNINGVIIGRVVSDSRNGRIVLKGSQSIIGKPKRPDTIVNPEQQQECCCSTHAETATAIEDDSECLSTQKDLAEPSCCSGQQSKTSSGTLPLASASIEFGSYMKAVNTGGEIGAKDKKLMALALSVSHKCGECITLNAAAAKKLGATENEISEAAAMGISFGGASANMFYNQLRK